MTGLMQRIFRRRASGSSSHGSAGHMPRPAAGLRRPRPGRKGLPWGKRAQAPQPAALGAGDGVPVAEVVETAGTASFRDRGRLRRRLRYLRRARELAFRDVGGLIFDMRRFGRERPDLVEAKLGALTAVDAELRALERVLDDRRPIHELREPGLSSCPRCGALHASEDNFCPRCGLQFGGAQAIGEVGGAIAAPPQAPAAPVAQTTSPTLVAPGLGDTRPAKAPDHDSVRPQPTSSAPADARETAAPSDGGGSAACDDQPTEIYRPPDGL
jgi:ribosomal protein L32